MLKTSTLNRRLTLRHATDVLSDSGQVTQTYADSYADVWASIRPESSQENEQATGLTAIVFYLISMHERQEVRHTDRFDDENGTSYNVESVLHIHDDKSTVCRCRRVEGDA